ncbi:hypothetical protein KFE25_004196 [Diacronema lutheri]|uniref:EF-hand domain-containing protein n=1 Tax=Diacronema lutheri TaxID=2081491 RepID=A0A8J5X975_DIALT|nr:hypothetical protein KFE25_004196 [Diacronema lutheri]
MPPTVDDTAAAAKVQAHARGARARKEARGRQQDSASTKIQRALRGKAGRKQAAAAAEAVGKAVVRPQAVVEMNALRRLRHEREMWRRTVPEHVIDRAAHVVALKWAPFPMPARTPAHAPRADGDGGDGAPAAEPTDELPVYMVLVQHGGFGPFVPLSAAHLDGAPADAHGAALVRGGTSCRVVRLVASQRLRLVLRLRLPLPPREAEMAAAAEAVAGGGEYGAQLYHTAPSALITTPPAASLAVLAQSVDATAQQLRALADGADGAALGLASARLEALEELFSQAHAAIDAAAAGDVDADGDGDGGGHWRRSTERVPTVRTALLALALEPRDDESDMTLGAAALLHAWRAPDGVVCALALEPTDGVPVVRLTERARARTATAAGVPALLELGDADQEAARAWLGAALGNEHVAASARFLHDARAESVRAECPAQLVGEGAPGAPPGCVRLVHLTHATAALAALPMAARPALRALPAPFPRAHAPRAPDDAPAAAPAAGAVARRGWWAWRRRAVARALHAAAADALAPARPLAAATSTVGAARAADAAAGAPPARAPPGASARGAELRVEWLGAQKLVGFDGAAPAALALRALLPRATSVALRWEGGTLAMAGAGVARFSAWAVDGLTCPPRALGACALRVGDAARVRAEFDALARARAAGGPVVRGATCMPLAFYDSAPLAEPPPAADADADAAARRARGAGGAPPPLAGARLLHGARATSGWGLGEARGRSAAGGGLGCVRYTPLFWSVRELCARHVHEMEAAVLKRLGYTEPLPLLPDLPRAFVAHALAPFCVALAARTGRTERVDLLRHYGLPAALRALSDEPGAHAHAADALDALLAPAGLNYSPAAKAAFNGAGVRHWAGYTERLACLADTLERGVPSADVAGGTGRVPPIGSPPLDADVTRAIVRALTCELPPSANGDAGASRAWPTCLVHGGEDWPAALSLDGALRLAVAFAPVAADAGAGAPRVGRSTAPLPVAAAAAAATAADGARAREPASASAPHDRAVRAHALADLAQLEVALLLEWTCLEDETDLADMLHLVDLLASRASLFVAAPGGELPPPSELVPPVRTNVARAYQLLRQLREKCVEPCLRAAGDGAGDAAQLLVPLAAACARLLAHGGRALPTSRNRAACAYAAMRYVDALLDPLRARAAERVAAGASHVPRAPPPPDDAQLVEAWRAHAEEELAAASAAPVELLTGRPLPVEALAFRLVRTADAAHRSAAEAAADDAADTARGDASRAAAVQCLGALAPGRAPAGEPYSNAAATPVRALAVGPPALVARERGLCARLALELIGSQAADNTDGTGDSDAQQLLPLTIEPRALAHALGAAPSDGSRDGSALLDALLDAEHGGARAGSRAAAALGALRAARRVALLLPELHVASHLATARGVRDAPARLWRLLAHGDGAPLAFGTATSDWAVDASAAAAHSGAHDGGGGGDGVVVWHVATPTVAAQWAALETLLAPTALEAASAARLLARVGAGRRSLATAELAVHGVRAAVAERSAWDAEGHVLGLGLLHALRDAPFGAARLARADGDELIDGGDEDGPLVVGPSRTPRAPSPRGPARATRASIGAARAPAAGGGTAADAARRGAQPSLPAHERCARLLGNVAYTLCLRDSLELPAAELEHFVDAAASDGGKLGAAETVSQLVLTSGQRLLRPAAAFGRTARRDGQAWLALPDGEVRALLCAMHLAAQLREEVSAMPSATSLAATRTYARSIAPTVAKPQFAPVLRLLGGLLPDGLLGKLGATLIAATRDTSTAAAAAAAAAAVLLAAGDGRGGAANAPPPSPPSDGEARVAVWQLLVPHACRPHKAAYSINAAIAGADHELRMAVAREMVAGKVGVGAAVASSRRSSAVLSAADGVSALLHDGDSTLPPPTGGLAQLGEAELQALLDEGIEREDAAFEIFTHFDTNGDGSIDASELGAVLRRMAIVEGSMPQHALDEFVATQLALADVDSSGRLSFEEFVHYYNTVCDLPALAAEQRKRAQTDVARRVATDAVGAQGGRGGGGSHPGGATARTGRGTPGAMSAMDDHHT